MNTTTSMNHRALGALGAAALAALALLAGCAGYRSGWESVAYLGDRPPAADDARPRTPPELSVPGLTLEVALDNRLRTSDRTVALFALPTSFNPRDAYPDDHAPGSTRVHVNVTPTAPGFVFRPRDAVLHVADTRVDGAAGFEFGMWDEGWRRVDSGGSWEHRPLDAEFALTEIGRTYLLSIDFPTPAPSPRSPGIALDLSRALVSGDQPAIPLIRFSPAEWRERYG